MQLAAMTKSDIPQAVADLRVLSAKGFPPKTASVQRFKIALLRINLVRRFRSQKTITTTTNRSVKALTEQRTRDDCLVIPVSEGRSQADKSISTTASTKASEKTSQTIRDGVSVSPSKRGASETCSIIDLTGETNDISTRPHKHQRVTSTVLIGSESSDPAIETTVTSMITTLGTFTPSDRSTYDSWRVQQSVRTRLETPFEEIEKNAVVYVLNTKEHPYVKIGYTTLKTAELRMARIARVDRISFVAKDMYTTFRMSIKRARLLEEVIHEHLSKFQRNYRVEQPNGHSTIHREYFEMDYELAKDTVDFWSHVVLRKDLGFTEDQQKQLTTTGLFTDRTTQTSASVAAEDAHKRALRLWKRFYDPENQWDHLVF